MSRFFSLFFVLLFAFSAPLFALENSDYLVENVAVNVTGKSPSLAKNIGVASARRDAFLILLTRMKLPLNLADNITDNEIADMVRSEQIDGEKIAGNSYFANFNIMFAKDFVDHILAQKTPQKIEEKKEETYLLIPVKMVKKRPILWDESNDWKKSLEKNLAKLKQNNFIIAGGDVDNLAVLNEANVENVEFATLEPMLARYKASAAYVTFFIFDEIENKVSINVSYIRKLQKKQLRLSFINVERLGSEALIDKVAAKVLEYLSSNQTKENKALNNNLIRIEIPISSLSNYLAIKSKIETSNLVNQMSVDSLSRQKALIVVNYVNAGVDIADSFAKIGIILEKKSEGFYEAKN